MKGKKKNQQRENVAQSNGWRPAGERKQCRPSFFVCVGVTATTQDANKHVLTDITSIYLDSVFPCNNQHLVQSVSLKTCSCRASQSFTSPLPYASTRIRTHYAHRRLNKVEGHGYVG